MSDFQDLLDAIKTAKSILEPGRIEEIRETYKLERQNQLDVENLKIVRSEITKLESKKEKALESLTELEEKLFVDISPNTQNASNLIQGKVSDLEGLIGKLESQKSELASDVRRVKGVVAAKGESSKRLLYMASQARAEGWSAELFEEADYDLAEKNYRKELSKSVKKDGSKFSQDEIDMRAHFFKNAYTLQYKSQYDAQFDEKYKQAAGLLNLSFAEWKSVASPSVSAGGVTPLPGAGIPSMVEEGWNVLEQRISGIANMMASGPNPTWTPANAPIKLQGGQYIIDSDKFDKLKTTYNDALTASVTQFLSAGDIENAMAVLYDNQGVAVLAEKGALLPGETFGEVVFGAQFGQVVDFYEAPDIKAKVHTRARSQTVGNKQRARLSGGI